MHDAFVSLFALIAVVGFGTNFIPVKKYEASDGMFFQLVMCMGIWFVGLFVFVATGANPKFETWAVLGGVIWCTGNIMCVPIIKLCGLGQGMLVWGASNMLTGWATGRFELFGVKGGTKNLNTTLNYIGVALAICALGLYALIKPNVKSDEGRSLNSGDMISEETSNSLQDNLLGEDYEENTEDCFSIATGTPHMMSNDLYMKKSTSNLALKALHDQHLNNETSERTVREALTLIEQGNDGRIAAIDALSPKTKKILGLSLALIAGLFFGSNFDPPLAVSFHHSISNLFVFSKKNSMPNKKF